MGAGPPRAAPRGWRAGTGAAWGRAPRPARPARRGMHMGGCTPPPIQQEMHTRPGVGSFVWSCGALAGAPGRTDHGGRPCTRRQARVPGPLMAGSRAPGFAQALGPGPDDVREPGVPYPELAGPLAWIRSGGPVLPDADSWDGPVPSRCPLCPQVCPSRWREN